MKNILVIYYTQSGQIRNIVDSILLPMNNRADIKIDYEFITPTVKYPFPWGEKFFDCFPETVKGIPCKLESFAHTKYAQYDLVIIAYQPWYLSPSIPAWSFLESKEASILLKGKKVITIIGARNMWICAQEIVAGKLKELKAELVGNIVLTDKHDNYISAITIIRWLIKGKKKPTWVLPEAGVSEKDILNASVFGDIVHESIITNDWKNLQTRLLGKKALRVKYHILKSEKNARKIFDKFAAYVLKKGKAGDPARNKRIAVFKWYLLFVVFVISPLASLFFMIVRILFYRRTNKKILYYSGINTK